MPLRQGSDATQSLHYAVSAISYHTIHLVAHVSNIPKAIALFRVRNSRPRGYALGVSLHLPGIYSIIKFFLLLFFIVMMNLLKVDQNKKGAKAKKKISLASFRQASNSLKEDDKEMARLMEE